MFDYFGVLISVIFGLALTHLLRGVGRIIQMRQETRPYWVHIIWAINGVIFVLAVWWGMYWWKGLQDWSAEWFFFIAGYAVAIFMWAYVLFPAEFAPGVDFESYFYANRRWFFGIQTVVVLADIPETVQKGLMHLRPVPPQYGFVIAGLLVISIIGLITEKRRVHAVLCIAWLCTMLGYVFFSSLERIGARFA
jgi:hypothetical protein